MNGLRAIRLERNLTLQQVEDLTGIDSNTISRYERGVLSPTLRTAEKIATALNVSVDELLNTQKGKVKITLSYDWDKYEKGEINMSADLFELFLGSNGAVGIKGAGLPKTRKDLEELKALINEQIEKKTQDSNFSCAILFTVFL